MKLNTSVTMLFITTRHQYVFFCKCNAQNLVWNWYGSMKYCLSFLYWNLPFHSILASSIFHIEISIPFHSIFRSIPYHALVVFTIIIIIIVTFYPSGCSQFENLEAPDFVKIASASSSFSTLSLPSSLPLPTCFIKVLLLPLSKKINCFHRFRFQLPLPHP